MKYHLIIGLIFLNIGSYVFAACSIDQLQKRLDLNQHIATVQAGSLDDFEDRIKGFLELYFDSNQKFLFPLIALHGAKWAHDYMDKIDLTLLILKHGNGSIIFNKQLKKLKKVASTLKNINRKVFIDIVSKYKSFLEAPECYQEFIVLGIPKEIVFQLKNLTIKEYLTKAEKLKLYKSVLLYEQQYNVAPEIKRLEKSLHLSRFEKFIFLRPRVRFSYFPKSVTFRFKNFFDTKERIKYAIKAAEIALEVGEEQVVDSI